MIAKWWTVKDFVGSGQGLINILSQHIPGGNKKNHNEPQSGLLVDGPRYKPGSSQIQV